ncbi:decaprenyl-phosphate phosphoribosyltransferase [Candidatus Woesearchaeota archaeon]|nr:decaprenyl-phosphate phosphoribosyltransferase [Candidatus Woesearchaeota archaeon]
MLLTQLIKLCRPQQWYKNLVIFLPIIFAEKLLHIPFLQKIILGFISLSLISSTNYIINDIIDKKKDALNPEKKTRPIASGKVPVWLVLILAIILGALSIKIAINLSLYFLYSVIFLFVFTTLYSFIFKKEQFVDILSIAINFVVRAVSGAFIINIEITPWLIIGTAFLSLFLSVGKRQAEVQILGKKAVKHREVLEYYPKKITNSMMIISTTMLLLSYALYSFLNNQINLLLTFPFAIYVVFRYLYLIYKGSIIARHPEKAYKDKRLVISSILLTISIFIALYVI